MKEYQRLLAVRTRRHHALLMVGPAGTGKSALALAIAGASLCERPQADGSACGACEACNWFADGNHPDFRLLSPASADEVSEPEGEEIDGDGRSGASASKPAGAGRATAARKAGKGGKGSRASREIRIEQIRGLDAFLEVGAHRGGERVILVDPADAMNTIAANALLKRLEEPPPRTGFILVTDRPSKLPATIRSRCQRVSLPMPAPDLAAAWLARETGVSAQQAKQSLAAAGGAPLHALQRSSDEEGSAAYRRIVDAFASLPEAGIVETADALNGVEPPQWAGPAQTWAADLVRVRAGAAPRRHSDRLEVLRRLAARSTLGRLTSLEQRLRALPQQASHPLNPRLLLEDVLLDYHKALS